MTKVATLSRKRFGLAEKKIMAAHDGLSLSAAWTMATAFPEGSAERAALAKLYDDKHAQLAVEGAKYSRVL